MQYGSAADLEIGAAFTLIASGIRSRSLANLSKKEQTPHGQTVTG
jgi:hypothetical protein